MADWQKDFTLKAIETQAQVYAFESELRQQEQRAPKLEDILTRTFQALRGLGMIPVANIEAEHHLRAGIKAGWIAMPTAEIAEITDSNGRKRVSYQLDGKDVSDLHPGKVRWYGQRLLEAYNAAVAIPDPNS